MHQNSSFVSSSKGCFFVTLKTRKAVMREVKTLERYISENSNPDNKRVGDCTIRAISKLLCEDWEKIYIELCVQGYMMSDMPSANHVWGSYLKNKGYKRAMISDECPDNYTVDDFCRDNPKGRYLLAISGHVVPVVDGKYYDTWDSGNEVPIYYWYKNGENK